MHIDGVRLGLRATQNLMRRRFSRLQAALFILVALVIAAAVKLRIIAVRSCLSDAAICPDAKRCTAQRRTSR